MKKQAKKKQPAKRTRTDFGAFLKELRVNSGITQASLAKALRFNRGNIATREGYGKQPRPADIQMQKFVRWFNALGFKLIITAKSFNGRKSFVFVPPQARPAKKIKKGSPFIKLRPKRK